MTTKELFESLKNKLNVIQGNWNGKESGLGEDRYLAAEEGLKNISELENILEELNLL